MRLYIPQTRSFHGLDDSLTPALCRSMTPNQSGNYLQVPSPTPMWEPDVSVGVRGARVAYQRRRYLAIDKAGNVVSSNVVSSRPAYTCDRRVMFRDLFMRCLDAH